MELTPEQQNAIARLYENESLTENLTDQDAQALLEWAQGQIVARTDDSLVRAAVSAANSSGEQGVQALVTQASTFLAQELAVRAEAAARSNESSAPATMGTGPASPAAPAPDTGTDQLESPSIELTGRPFTTNDAVLGASGSTAPQHPLAASAGASVGPDASPPSRKPKRNKTKSKRAKKK